MKPSLVNKNRCTVYVDSCYHNSIADVYELIDAGAKYIQRI